MLVIRVSDHGNPSLMRQLMARSVVAQNFFASCVSIDKISAKKDF